MLSGFWCQDGQNTLVRFDDTVWVVPYGVLYGKNCEFYKNLTYFISEKGLRILYAPFYIYLE